MNGKILNKRTLKVAIAEDNGRAKEFIRRRVSSDAFIKCFNNLLPISICYLILKIPFYPIVIQVG